MALVSALSKAVFWLGNRTSHPRYEAPCERPEIILRDASTIFPLLGEGIPVDISSYGCQTPDILEIPVTTYRTLLKLESKILHENFAAHLRLVTAREPLLVLINALHNPIFFLLSYRNPNKASPGSETKSEQSSLQKSKQLTHENASQTPQVDAPRESQTPQVDGPRESRSHRLMMDLSILDVEVKPGYEPLATITHFRRVRNTSLLKITSITWKGKKIKPEDPLFQKAVSVVVCGAATLLTMRDHLLYTHLLATGSTWCLAARNLPPTHYIYQILHPHTYAVNRVNVRKGIGLMDVFKEDFSFTETGLRDLMDKCVQTFRLQNLTPIAIAQRCGSKAAALSSVFAAATRMWNATQEYVNAWFGHGTCVIPASDVPAARFIADMQSLPFDMNVPGNTRTDYIRNLLTHVIYTSIFYHEAVGDAIEPLAKVMMPWIPKEGDKNTVRRQLVSKAIVLVVFWAATIYEYQLSKPEWIEVLPPWIQKAAFRFQQEAIRVCTTFEVGVNK